MMVLHNQAVCVVGSKFTDFVFVVFKACGLENIMNGFDSVFLDTFPVARGGPRRSMLAILGL